MVFRSSGSGHKDAYIRLHFLGEGWGQWKPLSGGISGSVQPHVHAGEVLAAGAGRGCFLMYNYLRGSLYYTKQGRKERFADQGSEPKQLDWKAEKVKSGAEGVGSVGPTANTKAGGSVRVLSSCSFFSSNGKKLCDGRLV